MKTVYETEVVVIGAGAIGCSIAYQLAKCGKDVTLVDRAEPGAGTSSYNFGLVWATSKEPLSYMELNLRSSQMFPRFVEELGEDVDLRQGGGLKLCLTEEEYRKAEGMMKRLQCSPLYQGRMLSPTEVFEMQPGVSRDIIGAMWSPHDGDINWVKWTQALARGCKRVGVTMLMQTEITGIERGGDGQVTGVLTNSGRIGTSNAVNAAGVWSPQIAAMVDVTIDLYPQRGQILETAATDIICPVPMSTVRQDPRGQFYMGTTAENVGFDWSTTPEAATAIREKAAKLVPKTRELKVVRHFSGLRPMPRDGLPFLGPVPHVSGFYVATSHSGITLSPIHGKVISDLIVNGQTDIPIADYDPLRFDTKRPLPTRPAPPTATLAVDADG